MRTERWLGPLLALLLLMPAAPARALDWNLLDADQRALLAPFEASWARLPKAQQQQLRDNADRWRRLDPPAQARLQQRLARWLALPATQRQRLRLRHQRYVQLPAATRAALERAAAAYQALPEAERQTQRDAFTALPTARRRGYLMTIPQRELVELTGRLFAFIPPDELPATLALLEALPLADRQRLEQRLRRMPPWQREALRSELLQATPAERRRLLDAP